MAGLLVIGGASLDILHLGGARVPSAGGAGMYTAMAAHRAGADVSLFAPRPSPVPRELVPVAERVHDWIGPVVAPADLPRFEISQEGGSTTYVSEFLGSEAEVLPAALPASLARWDGVHVIPLGNVGRQLEFVRAARARGARLLSAGTYLRSVQERPGDVRRLLEETDVFFMNEAETEALFGSLGAARAAAGRLLVVTRGPRGARVLQGSHATDVPAVPAREVDPTGAGDTFCGATLAGLLAGLHPVAAARAAAPLAAEMIGQVGPAALLSDAPPPPAPSSGAAVVDGARVAAVSRLLAGLPEAGSFPFVGPGLPEVGDPAAVDYFFSATLQQFGFWEERDGRYGGPMAAPLGGTLLKGSDYLFAAWLRAARRDPGFLAPARQAALSREELREVFRADDGSDPMPALDLHLAQARAYGEDMLALGFTPRSVLDQARASPTPLRSLSALLDGVGGYKEDPLRKKSGLLALILSQRPEGFLRFAPGEEVEPVIDYHLMRSCLRTGLVDVRDEAVRAALVERRLLEQDAECAVREASWRAIRAVIAASGRGAGAVDWFFFGARRRCPEMTRPDCARCPLDPTCAHRVQLFQPVRRTGFY